MISRFAFATLCLAAIILAQNTDTETDTQVACGELEFDCDGKGTCIPVGQRCNGVNNCINGLDELNCGELDTVDESIQSNT